MRGEHLPLYASAANVSTCTRNNITIASQTYPPIRACMPNACRRNSRQVYFTIYSRRISIRSISRAIILNNRRNNKHKEAKKTKRHAALMYSVLFLTVSYEAIHMLRQLSIELRILDATETRFFFRFIVTCFFWCFATNYVNLDWDCPIL